MGAAGNLNYTQVADFFLGFAGIDIARDDGRHLGLWPWESDDRTPSKAAVALRRSLFGEASLPRDAYAARRAEHEPEPEQAPAPAPRPEPPAKAKPVPEAKPEPPPRPAPTRAEPRTKVEFCLHCGGRKYPAHALAAGDGSPHEHLSDDEKAGPGRWCVCHKQRTRHPQAASAK